MVSVVCTETHGEPSCNPADIEDNPAAALHKTYTLAPGSQVREEDFGLLFYTMAGPRLYFISSGRLLEPAFFQGQLTLAQQVQKSVPQGIASPTHLAALQTIVNRLKNKGVILEH